jgi:hypothetical protein
MKTINRRLRQLEEQRFGGAHTRLVVSPRSYGNGVAGGKRKDCRRESHARSRIHPMDTSHNVSSATLGDQLSAHSFRWEGLVAARARRLRPTHRPRLNIAFVRRLKDLKFQSRWLPVRTDHAMP